MPCEIIRKLAQELLDANDTKIASVRAVLEKHGANDSDIREELKALLKTSAFTNANIKLVEIWETQARIGQRMLQLKPQEDQAGQYVQKTEPCSLESIEAGHKKKLVVITEGSGKAASQKFYVQPLHDQSFKLGMEELVKEQSLAKDD